MTEHEYKQLSAPVDLKAVLRGLSPERRNAADAMRNLMQLTRRLETAIAARDQHEYRRLLRVRRLAARRMARRFEQVTPGPARTLAAIHQAPQMPRERYTAKSETLKAVA